MVYLSWIYFLFIHYKVFFVMAWFTGLLGLPGLYALCFYRSIFTIVKIRKVYRFTWFTLVECILCPYIVKFFVMAWFTGLLGLPGLYALCFHRSIFSLFTGLLGLLSCMLILLVYIFHGWLLIFSSLLNW